MGLTHLRRIGSTLKWAVRSGPRKVFRHRAWFLRSLVSRKAATRTSAAGRVIPLSISLVEHHCQPMMRPRTVPAAKATHMRDDDVVLGAVLGGVARAYPWWIMDDHHVANDELGGQPVTILLCDVCSSALAFDPRVRGRVLTFEQWHMYNGTITIDDQQTLSVWAPLEGRAIRGKLKGETLSLLPLWQMSWKEWRRLHPDTDVLAPELGSRTGHGARQRPGSPRVGAGMRASLVRWDTRLPHNTLVLAVSVDSRTKAYPLEALRDRNGVVNDELGGHPIAVFHHLAEGSFGAMAYSRATGERVLTFEAGPGGPRDRDTGSRWTPEGRAVEGPLAGMTLSFVPSYVVEWYAVAASGPEVETFG